MRSIQKLTSYILLFILSLKSKVYLHLDAKFLLEILDICLDFTKLTVERVDSHT